MTPRDVLKLIEQKNVQFIDLRFMDFPGLWQHLTLPVSELTLDSFDHGFGFDGSSIRGWQAINESDMLLVPVAHTAKVDPFMLHTTVQMICDVRDPITKKEYSRDPRSIARKAVTFLKKTKIADTAYFGPELEFFIFDYAWYDQGINFAKYHVGSREGVWGRGEESETNLGYKVRLKEGYFPPPPMDTMQNIRSEMVTELINLGIPVEAHHHEVATGGQCEIDMRYQDLLTMADSVMIYKYVCKNVAARHGKIGDVHAQAAVPGQRVGDARPLLAVEGGQAAVRGEQVRGAERRGAVGDRRDAQARPGAVRPVQPDDQQLQAAGAGVRGAGEPGLQQPQPVGRRAHPDVQREPQDQAGRVPLPRRVGNPYLAFSAITMAAIDGIQNKIDPGDPLDKDMYRLTPDEYEKIRSAPGSLEEALDALENDHEFLLNGDVFTADVIHYWIKYKRENEVDAVRVRPHPYEFCMYFDI